MIYAGLNEATIKQVGNKTFTVVNGVYHGEAKEVDDKGNLVAECNYKNGKLDGLFIRYYPDGETIESSSEYRNGKLEGHSHSYHPNGKLAFEGSYKNGLAQGLHIHYNEDGSFSSKCNYINGKRNGNCYYYNKEGVFKCVVFKNDKCTKEDAIMLREFVSGK